MPASSPPLASLRAFVIAARRGSFRDAAGELRVTPSAVSHQIRALEAWIGAALFERGVRQIRLTPAGERLSSVLTGAFADIERALIEARGAGQPRVLRIAALPLFTSVWLTARLARFEADHPDLSLVIDTEARVTDLAKREADVAIRNVPAPSVGLAVRKLLDLRATPLCTPETAANLNTPADLAQATLIGLSVGRAGWPDWLAAAGVAGLAPKRTLTFDNMPAAIEAAAQGRGVMLALLPLVWEAPAAGRLVAPFTLPPMDAGAYFVACRREDRDDATVRAFIDWLFAEMRADRRRLARAETERLARKL